MANFPMTHTIVSTHPVGCTFVNWTHLLLRYKLGYLYFYSLKILKLLNVFSPIHDVECNPPPPKRQFN